jgi:hypothetical protein
MERQYRMGNATIVVNCAEYNAAQDIGDDAVGGGDAVIKTRDFHRVLKRQGFLTYSVTAHEVAEHFREDPDGEISVSNDDLIGFLNAIQTEPQRKFSVYFGGLSYWFWHDVTHAKNDVQGGIIHVDATSENRALYNGAKLALEQGTPLEQIVRELVNAEGAYETRFNAKSNALERFLSEIKVDI